MPDAVSGLDIALADRDHGVHGLQQRQDGCKLSGHRHVGDDHLVFGLVGDEGDLLGRQPDVERVQHRTHRWDGQVRGQVLGVVPHEGRHPLVAGDTDAAQRIRQPGRLLPDFAIGRVPVPVTRRRRHRAVAVHIARVSHDAR